MRQIFLTDLDLVKGWRWPHVDPKREWACKGTGAIVVETEFLDRFEKLRQMWGRALPITSGYRSPEYNMKVAGTGPEGPHTTARAVDVLVSGADALHLIALASGLGFTGVGANQKGEPGGRFLHLDDLAQPAWPRPMMWTY